MPIQFVSVSDPSFKAWLLRISSTTFTTHLTTLTALKWKKSWQQNIFVLVLLRYMRIHALKQHNNWIEIFVRCGCPLETVSSIHYEVDGRGVWRTRNLGLLHWNKYRFTGYIYSTIQYDGGSLNRPISTNLTDKWHILGLKIFI